MRQYEGMFLFDAATVTSEAEAKEEVQRLLERSEAEIVVCRKWEERRLAYEIKKCKRGLYMLAYFRAAPDRVRGLEQDARLSEKVLRLLVLRADWVTQERMGEILPERLQASTPTESDGKPTNDGDTKASDQESPDKMASTAGAVTGPPEGVELNAVPASSEGGAAVEPTPME